MGLKEKMMDSMMENMSKKEKMDMMDKMMDTFFSSMSNEERNDMMQNIMPKMMQQMMGGKGHSMMGMMGKMMECCKDSENGGEGFNPMDMCREMIGSIRQGQKIATLATPEVQGLFEDWVEQIEKEMKDYVQKNGNVDIQNAAKHFKVSEDSVYYFLTRLAQKGEIDIQAVKTEKK